MPRLVRARLTRLAQVNFASMKCVVALALAFTAQAVDVDWRIPGGNHGAMTPPTINDDSVIGPADVLATNGVIHVIDTVLMPPSDEPTKGPTAMEESDSAGRAVAAAAAVAYVL